MRRLVPAARPRGPIRTVGSVNREPTYPCRCGDQFGWLNKTELIDGEPVKTVIPCPDCNATVRARWAGGFYKSGPNYAQRDTKESR